MAHALLYGWHGQVIIVILTHVEDAVPMFFPISSYIFRIPVSYWDDGHYAGAFSLINTTLTLVSLIYLFIKNKGETLVHKKFMTHEGAFHSLSFEIHDMIYLGNL